MTRGTHEGRWAGALIILTAANLAAQAVPSQLGVSEPDAQESFLQSVVSGYPEWGMAGAAFVALPAAARVAVVQGGFAWARAYVKSTGFRTGYESARQRMKPQAPEVEGTVDDEVKRQVAEQLADLEETRKAMGQLPADQRKDFEAMLQQTAAQLKDPEYLGMLRSAIEAERASEQETHQTRMQEWAEAYPANPDLVVRRRLEAFLTECADVDFSAKLQSQYGMMRFVNPDYEMKPANWKTCYRAGPDAVGAARAAATAWLEALKGT